MLEKPRRKKGYIQKGGQDSLLPDDVRLWQEYTRDIAPLDGCLESEDSANNRGKKESFVEKVTPPSARSASPVPPAVPQSSELDFRTDQKLRRGKMEIDGTLDLHGMTQARAHTAVNDFILQAYKRSARCLLVITGKGKSGEGVLKQKLSDWLSQAPLNGMILKITPAQPRHGGGGAFYVYLRRKRH